MKSFSLPNGLRIGADAPLLVITGPCQIESEFHCLKMAEAVSSLLKGLPVNVIFKSSFDKANRTSLSGARGVGMDEGLRILEKVRNDCGLPLLTDIHDETQVAAVAEVVDVLQIPAFLCRQTDLLIAAGATQKVVHVKKGQFLHPGDMKFAAEKISSTGNHKILLCERGTCHGYRDLVVDMRSLIIMRELGYPVVFDATHSVQSLGGSGSGSSGGTRSYVAPLARAATAIGIDGVFLEAHDDPDHAPSDGPSMLELTVLAPLVKKLCEIREASKT